MEDRDVSRLTIVPSSLRRQWTAPKLVSFGALRDMVQGGSGTSAESANNPGQCGMLTQSKFTGCP